MMRIPVVMKDGTERLVDRSGLVSLIAEQQIMFFKRKAGWVVVGRDNVRGAGGVYLGAERRHD